MNFSPTIVQHRNGTTGTSNSNILANCAATQFDMTVPVETWLSPDSPRSTLIAVAGEAGIGKTATCEQLRITGSSSPGTGLDHRSLEVYFGPALGGSLSPDAVPGAADRAGASEEVRRKGGRDPSHLSACVLVPGTVSVGADNGVHRLMILYGTSADAYAASAPSRRWTSWSCRAQRACGSLSRQAFSAWVGTQTRSASIGSERHPRMRKGYGFKIEAGDTKLIWDTEPQAENENARRTLNDLTRRPVRHLLSERAAGKGTESTNLVRKPEV